MLFAILWILDIRDVFVVGGYPFGREYSGQISIYNSKEVYVAYHLVEILFLLAMIYFTFKQRWKIYYLLLGINLLLFIYPILTVEH